MSLLDDILRNKRREIKKLKMARPLARLKKEALRLPKAKGRFLAALKKNKGRAVIAEIKRRSPSKGLLCKNFDPVRIARSYRAGGASALSVLTDAKYFGGSAEILKRVRKAVSLPILRKDFTVDEYQIYEARLLGADAVLLIVRALSAATLRKFYSSASKLGLDVLFEVHDTGELKKIAGLKPRLVGVNNRDLSTFYVDLGVTRRLAKRAPKGCLLVSESGIASSADIERLRKYGAGAFLVGETLMREKDPGAALRRLLGKKRGSR